MKYSEYSAEEFDSLISIGEITLDEAIAMKKMFDLELRRFISKYPEQYWKELVKRYNNLLNDRAKLLIEDKKKNVSQLRKSGVPFVERKKNNDIYTTTLENSIHKAKLKPIEQWLTYQRAYECNRVGMKMFTIMNYDLMVDKYL